MFFLIKKGIDLNMAKRRKILSLFLASVMALGSVNTSYIAHANTINKVSKTSSIADTITEINYPKISNISENTILGADFSNYQQDLIWGKTYKDYKNNDISDTLFDFVKSQGINTISVKVSTDDKSSISLENAIKTLKEAQKSGLKTNMVLLYSDEMTYGNKQDLPKSWANESDITTKACDYTKSVLEKLAEAGVKLDILTIGNEVNYNFLGYTEDSAYKGWEAMAKIAAIAQDKGIKASVSISETKTPEDIKWVLQKLNQDYLNVDFDYVGVNIYPTDNTVSYINDMRKVFEEEEKSSGKKTQLYISGVKYARQDDKGIASVSSQANNIYKVLEAGISENNTGGLVYTGAEDVGSWTSFFDENGKAIQSLSIFALARGLSVDNDVEEEEKDPYQYGGESGLKEEEVTIKRIDSLSANSIRGVDISSYTALKKAGVKYYNFNGEEESLIKILADNGVNYIRIRVWNDPYNENGETYGGGACDIESGLEIAREAAKYDMKLLVDLHYSDFWADPATQIIPKAWKVDEDNPEKMAQHVYDYTKEVIEKFQETGIEIGMVQVGNEITKGMLDILTDYGKNVKNSKLVNKYLAKGCQAVRDTAPNALIALHLETQNIDKYRTIMEGWERDNVDYDILGTSHYAFWGNTIGSLEGTLKLAQEYGKFVTVLETGWLASTKDADGTPNNISADNVSGGYSVSVQGQVDMLTSLYQTLSKYDNGLGAFYWEPAWVPAKAGWANWEYNKEMADIYGTGWASKGAVGYYPDDKLYYNGNPAWGGTSWDNQTLFDMNGHALQSLKFYKQCATKKREKILVVRILDENGNKLRSNYLTKIDGRSIKPLNLPEIEGYITPEYKISNISSDEDVIFINATYTKSKTISISSATVSNIKDKSYTGKEQTQDMVVSVNGKTLEKNKDYTVKYSNNKSIGTATITITGKGNYTGEKKVTFKIYPGKVTGQKVSSIEKTSLKIKWDKVSGVTGYKIYRSTSKNGTYKCVATVSSKNNTYTNTGLITGTTYYYKIRAYKTVGNENIYGSYSTIFSGKTKGLSQVKNLKQTVAEKTSVKLSWSKVSDASGYRVYRSTSKDGTYKLVADLSGSSKTSYTNKNLSPGKTYYYKVRAYKKVGSNRDYGSYSSKLKASTKCNAPVISTTSNDKGKVKITWKKVSGASGYAIYRSTSKNGSYQKIKTLKSGSTLSFIDTNLKSKKTYYYKVKAYKSADMGNVYSAYSSMKSVKVK